MSAHFWPFTFWKPDWWQQWFRISTSHLNSVTLNSRVIYIVPSRWGALFGVMAILLLLGSINYSLSLGYYLTFLLVSLGVVAMFHTWLNLAYLTIELSSAPSVFAGKSALVQLTIRDYKCRRRSSIVAHFDGNETVDTDIAANQAAVLKAPITTHQRGWLTMPKLVLYTEFPLGLFHAWSVIHYPHQLMVYAKPSEHTHIASNNFTAGQDKPHPHQKGDDDFYGHKAYQQGDTLSRVDWKASVRNLGMLSKVYAGNVQTVLWLDWTDTSHLEFEMRISTLTKAVIEAHASGVSYGLKLPNETFDANYGEAHYHRCLQALALL